MSSSKSLGILLRGLSWLFVLFALPYGCILASTDLRGTIHFDTAAEAAAAQRTLLLCSIPYIVLASTLLVLLIVFYLSRKKKQDRGKSLRYAVLVTCIGVIYTLGISGIAVCIDEASLIVCIVPAVCLAVYGACQIAATRKMRGRA